MQRCISRKECVKSKQDWTIGITKEKESLNKNANP